MRTPKITASTRIADLPFVGEAPAKPDISGLVSEFKNQLILGTEAWVRAGLALVEAFRLDPDAMAYVIRTTNVAPATVRLFLRIGAGTLLPQLVYSTKRLRSLPLEDQKRVVSGTLPRVIIKDGRVDSVRVDLMSATPEILDQMIGPSGLRSEREQAAWLHRKTTVAITALAERPHARWKVENDHILVTETGVFTTTMIFSMLKRLRIKVKRVR